MAEPFGGSPVQRPSWLVWAKEPTISLSPLLARFAMDAETEIVRTLGPPAHPHTAVVRMSVAIEQRYQEELHDKYFFELDAPLSPQASADEPAPAR